MIPCVSQVCTLPKTFAEDIAAFAEAGATHMEVWLTKLEQHLAAQSVEDTRSLMKDCKVTPLVASQQGGLLLSQGESRRVTSDHFKQRLELCQRLSIPTLVVTADFTARPGEADLARALVSLTQAAQWAAGFDVTLALEFRGADSFCNNLATALDLIEQCNEPNLGVCLDVFHYYKGPSKSEDLERLTPQTLAHVQLCDVVGVPRELMADPDRIFPGEGDFLLGTIVQRLKAIGYRNAVSLELMNSQLWKVKSSQVIELGLTALRNVIVSGT